MGNHQLESSISALKAEVESIAALQQLKRDLERISPCKRKDALISEIDALLNPLPEVPASDPQSGRGPSEEEESISRGDSDLYRLPEPDRKRSSFTVLLVAIGTLVLIRVFMELLN